MCICQNDIISVKRAELEIVRQAEFVHVGIRSARIYNKEHKSNTM